MAHRIQQARRGAVMIVVLGLITILLSLVLGVTVKVYNGIKNGANVTQNAQAWIMMQAARIYMTVSPSASPTAWPADARLTIGNIPTGSIAGKPLADRLGWAHIRQVGTGLEYYVLATGGGSGQGELKASSMTDGDPTRNAMDLRYLYRISYLPGPPGGWDIALVKAATEAYINANYW